MTRPILKLKSPPVRWRVETAQIVQLPEFIEALTIEQLRQELQKLACTYRPRPGKPPLGLLSFRYEHDCNERIAVVHAYFRGSDKKLKRFARLRKVVR